MKTYVLIVSEKFPKKSLFKGGPTGFVQKIESGLKSHTVRGNYPLWKKRITEVADGKARLSIRIWTGKPYRSPQREIREITKANCPGVEKLQFLERVSAWTVSCKLTREIYMNGEFEPVKSISGDMIGRLAENDGLTIEQFADWFRDVKPGHELAIIHFTGFRYLNYC